MSERRTLQTRGEVIEEYSRDFPAEIVETYSRPLPGAVEPVPLYSTRRENVKVVTPFSLVTLISSLCCCKMVLTIYRPKP